MNQIDALKKKIKDQARDIRLLKRLIDELKQSKKDMIKFYQAEIKVLRDKIKELIRDATD